MPRHINRGLSSPANRSTLERSEKTICKLHVFAEIVVTEIDVAASRRFNVTNNLLDGTFAIHAIVDGGYRTVLTRERTTTRRLHGINDDSIFLDQIVPRNRQVADVRRTF